MALSAALQSPTSSCLSSLAGHWLAEEERRLTELSDLQDLTEHLGELDGTAAKWTLVFILPATVLQHNLQAEKEWGLERGRHGWASGLRGCPAFTRM